MVSLEVSANSSISGAWSQGQLIEITLQVAVSGQAGEGFSGADFRGPGRGIIVDTNYLKIHDILYGTTQVDTESEASAYNGLAGYSMSGDTWWHEPFNDFTGPVMFSSDGRMVEAVVGAPAEAGLNLGLSGPVDFTHLVLEVQPALSNPWMATEVWFGGQLVSYDLPGPNQVNIFGNLSAPGVDTGSGSFRIVSEGFYGGGILSTIMTNWGLAGATRAQGDLSGDGWVGGLDYTEVIYRWGDNIPVGQSAPEPGGIMLLAGAVAGGFLGRYRR